MRPARLALACTFAVTVLFGIGFLAGAVAGLAYTSRPKTCAVIEQAGAGVPVCEYDYHPPSGWEIR